MSSLKIIPKDNEFTVLFKSLVDKKHKIAVLGRSIDYKFTTQLSEYSQDGTFIMKYPVNVDLLTLKEKILSINEQESFLATIPVSGEVVGVNFKILGFISSGIVCEMPQDLYQINRRSSKRTKVIEEFSRYASMEIFMPSVSPSVIIFPVVDLSLHGLCVKIPFFVKSFIQKEMIFPKIKLKLGTKEFELSAQVRNMFVNPEGKYPFRVGLKFVKISLTHQEEISKFIKQLESKVANAKKRR